jgi:hypothetical protein
MFWPDISSESGPKTHFAMTIAQNAIQDHERALISLKEQIDALKDGSSSSGGSSSGGSSGGGSTPVNPPPTTPTLGTVTVVTAATYSTQTSDYGGIVVFNSAVPVAVTLNYAVAINWFATYENIGAGLVTFTPNSGLVNGLASLDLKTGTGCVIYFDGMNFYAFTVPVVIPLELQTDGTPNGDQSLLNLVAGTNITLTDDGAGNVTIDAGGGGGTADRGPLQSNANGWWWVWTDGVIEQFGSITIASTTTNKASGLVTYPTAFTTQVFAFEAYIVGVPRPASNDLASVQSATVGLTTSGIDLQCNVPTGGGGATFDQAVVVQWRAIGI